MNAVHLSGTICGKPDEGRVGEDVLASFTVGVWRGKDLDLVFVPVKCKGETARKVLDGNRKGDKVLVEGQLSGKELFVLAWRVETVREAAALTVEQVAMLGELVDVADDTLRAGNCPPDALGKLKIARDCVARLKAAAGKKEGRAS